MKRIDLYIMSIQYLPANVALKNGRRIQLIFNAVFFQDMLVLIKTTSKGGISGSWVDKVFTINQ